MNAAANTEKSFVDSALGSKLASTDQSPTVSAAINGQSRLFKIALTAPTTALAHFDVITAGLGTGNYKLHRAFGVGHPALFEQQRQAEDKNLCRGCFSPAQWISQVGTTLLSGPAIRPITMGYRGHIATMLMGHRSDADVRAMNTAAHKSAMPWEIRAKLAPRWSHNGYARRIQ